MCKPTDEELKEAIASLDEDSEAVRLRIGVMVAVYFGVPVCENPFACGIKSGKESGDDRKEALP